MEFIKRSNAVSPTVTMETATALQVHLSFFLGSYNPNIWYLVEFIHILFVVHTELEL